MSFTSQYEYTPVATVNTNKQHHQTLPEGSVAYIYSVPHYKTEFLILDIWLIISRTML